ncbi:MAG TPA: ABC transporter permease [Chitinispirillaceae bacterium]|nr:ABC transporter permease [Chitinispirillaceae bacterium]
MIQRLYAIFLKELRHIIRDNQTLFIILAMPVIMMFLYGYALTMDIRDAPVLIINPTPSAEINELTSRIDASTLFKVIGTIESSSDPETEFRTRKMKIICRFPPSFTRDLKNGGSAAAVQVLIDGSDPNTATILKNAFEGVLSSITLDIIKMEPPDVVIVNQRILYNQEQKSALFFVPGLMAVILLMISALLTSLTITREKELGTLEQLLVSPLHPFEIILGKIIPYILLSGIDGILILITGKFAFGVDVAGSLTFLAVASVVYIFTSLSMGMLISTVATTQQQAMMMVLPATMLPTVVLSGFIFPLTSLPIALRLISNVIPATWFLQIIRGIILKGTGIEILWPQLVILCGISLFLITVSVKRFRGHL